MNSGMDMGLVRAVEDYLRQHKPGEIISLSTALRSVRGTLPDGPTNDDEIVELIARKAVARNYNLSFDHVRQRARGAGPAQEEAS